MSNRRNLEANFRKEAAKYQNLGDQLELRAQKQGVHILSLADSDIAELMPLAWSQSASNSLEFQIANWFAAWYGEWHYNRFDRYLATQEHDEDCKFFTDERFIARYGPEPWFVLNDVLKSAGVRYRLNKPESNFRNLSQAFKLRLVDPDDGTQIQINELSSGEKVLLAITLLLFRTSDDFGLARLPKLLLLDEVDALLHPFYAKALVDNLAQKMVATYGLNVIMVTHSPSTVALAPEGSVFELVRKPRELRAVTRSQAIQILSSGFVSVTPCDVIVITESSGDSDYYQPVFASLVHEGAVPSNPPLRFLAASKDGNDGQGGGFAQVSNWAPKLHELGLERFRGLIDRDSGRAEDEVVKVIGRYSMENYLFDPLTLCAFLVHRGVTKPFVGVEIKRADARELLSWAQPQLQQMIDVFLDWLAAEANDATISGSPRNAASYVGFPDLQMPSWWIEKNGHELERLVREQLNRLGQQERRGTGLIKADRSELITFQTRTLPESLSKDLVVAFKGLQTS